MVSNDKIALIRIRKSSRSGARSSRTFPNPEKMEKLVWGQVAHILHSQMQLWLNPWNRALPQECGRGVLNFLGRG